MAWYDKVSSRVGTVNPLASIGENWSSISGQTAKDRASSNADRKAQGIREQSDDVLSKMPGYEGYINDDGSLMNMYQMTPQQLDMAGYNGYMDQAQHLQSGMGYDTASSALGDLQGIAQSQGLSSVGQAQMDALGQSQSNLYDDLSQNLSMSRAQGMQSAATNGGLSTGAAERMSSNLGLQGLMEKQNIARQGADQSAAITSSDEMMKLGLLQNLPGQGLQVDQYATGLQGANNSMNLQKANMYGQQDLANANIANQAQSMNIGNALSGRQDKNANLYKRWQDEAALKGNTELAALQTQQSGNQMSFMNALTGQG